VLDVLYADSRPTKRRRLLEYDPTVVEDPSSLSHGVSLSLPFLGHSLEHTFPYGQSLNDGPVLLDAFTAEEYLEEVFSEEVSDFDDDVTVPVVEHEEEDFYIQENENENDFQPASQALFDDLNLQEYSEEDYSFVLSVPESVENNWLDILLFDAVVPPMDNLLDFYF
jgi:hypothetical protein